MRIELTSHYLFLLSGALYIANLNFSFPNRRPLDQENRTWGRKLSLFGIIVHMSQSESGKCGPDPLALWMVCQADVGGGWVLWGQMDECTKIKQTDEEQKRRRIQQQCKWSENMSIRTWLLNPGLSKEQSNVTQTEETGQSLQLSTGHTVSLIHYITTVNSHIYTSTNWQLIHIND